MGGLAYVESQKTRNVKSPFPLYSATRHTHELKYSTANVLNHAQTFANVHKQAHFFATFFLFFFISCVYLVPTLRFVAVLKHIF